MQASVPHATFLANNHPASCMYLLSAISPASRFLRGAWNCSKEHMLAAVAEGFFARCCGAMASRLSITMLKPLLSIFPPSTQSCNFSKNVSSCARSKDAKQYGFRAPFTISIRWKAGMRGDSEPAVSTLAMQDKGLQDQIADAK